jgi:hypothetical protein
VFPIIIFIVSFLVATNSINRLLVMMGMASMQFGSGSLLFAISALRRLSSLQRS